jgi:hypothetical protein
VTEGVEAGTRLYLPCHAGARGVARHVEQGVGLGAVAVPGPRAPAEFVDLKALGDEATPQ